MYKMASNLVPIMVPFVGEVRNLLILSHFLAWCIVQIPSSPLADVPRNDVFMLFFGRLSF